MCPFWGVTRRALGVAAKIPDLAQSKWLPMPRPVSAWARYDIGHLRPDGVSPSRPCDNSPT